tara:strand:+ start:170 stop:484 length:315 start_codon:yes stop_codon:yes gene_type:complete
MVLSLFVISLLSSFGLAVVLVEKGQEWPLRSPILSVRRFIFYNISLDLEKVFDCTVCMSFWASLLVDIILYLFFRHFLWPLSGFATLGFTWFIMQFLDAFDPKE